MTDPIIAVDMDSVLVPIVPKILARINDQLDTDYVMSDVNGWDFGECLGPAEADIAYSMIESSMLYEGLDPVDGALPGMKLLERRGRVVVVSAAAVGHATGKLRWLIRHGFNVKDVILTHDKCIVNADVLIDDRLSTVVEWTGTGRTGIVFDRPWNQSPRPIPRVFGWDEIPVAVETALQFA